MNGLANAILTLLLSWLRMIIDRIWAAVSSETGSQFFTFLSRNWLTILIILGAGGYLLDRIIYLIRWKPYLVRKRRREAEEWNDYDHQQSVDWQHSHTTYAAPASTPAPAMAEAPYSNPEPPMEPWAAQNNNDVINDPAYAQTSIYARPAVNYDAYQPPMEDIEPVFDEQASWSDHEPIIEPEAFAQPAGYQAVSRQYMQDVNAGFARPVPPEQLYAPAPQTYTPTSQPDLQPEAQPVHPGLDINLLRHNMGLASNGESQSVPVDPDGQQSISVSFTPFTQKAAMEQPAKKNRNPFLNLMRLVGDEAAKPSIHDLQSSVDVRDAFREPVYPKPLYRNEDDPS